MLCKSRITYESNKLLFGDNKHYFYQEFRCQTLVLDGVCAKCSSKTDTKVQESRSFDHGLIDENLTEKSHIFDGPWYLKYVRTYGEPSKEYIEVAMEAQKKARGGKVVSDSTVALVAVKPDITPKPKVVRRVKKTIVPDITGVIDTIPSSGFVESTDEPLEVEEVIRIVLKPFTHNSVIYWRDEERDKVYLNVKGQKGKYMGRWSGETIISCPDSDDD